MKRPFGKHQTGMTLVELVISIVIIGIAAAALYSAMASIGGRSADPLLRQQSLSIAEAYLEEILLQPYLDPATLAACQTIPGSRGLFDDACDYRGLDDAGARTASGAAIGALAGYRVQVTVAQLANWNGVPALRVDISVTDPGSQQVLLSGYRTCYGELDGGGVDRCP
ncbi:MAG: prepilin-type N-terminal cleavage/methylation domain-containing protein [Pseudomonadota bacterium]